MSENTTGPKIKRIAIVGAGVSGLSAAYFLEEATNVEVTLYEGLDRLGGNALTINATTPDGKTHAVDPVAYLFIKQRYPYFTKWLQLLKIKTVPLLFENYLWDEYRKRGMFLTSDFIKICTNPGKSLTYFRNLYFFKKIFRTISKLEKEGKLHDKMLMKEFMAHVPHVNQKFLNEVFYPLMTFAFHCDVDSLPNKPCGTTLRTYASAARDPNAAYCIKGGVNQYINAVHKSLSKTHVRTNTRVNAVHKIDGEIPRWQITTKDGEVDEFDQVILAIWPNQAAEVLKNGLNSGAELPELHDTVKILSNVELANCKATIHNDATVMPADKRNWATYSYKIVPYLKNNMATIWSGQTQNAKVFTTYDWSIKEENLLDSTNLTAIEGPVHGTNFHIRTPPRLPLYEAQAHIHINQGRDGLWFTGSYLRETGFHEDGLVSTIEVVKKLVPDYNNFNRLRSLLDK